MLLAAQADCCCLDGCHGCFNASSHYMSGCCSHIFGQPSWQSWFKQPTAVFWTAIAVVSMCHLATIGRTSWLLLSWQPLPFLDRRCGHLDASGQRPLFGWLLRLSRCVGWGALAAQADCCCLNGRCGRFEAASGCHTNGVPAALLTAGGVHYHDDSASAIV